MSDVANVVNIVNVVYVGPGGGFVQAWTVTDTFSESRQTNRNPSTGAIGACANKGRPPGRGPRMVNL